jgi:Cft2 family RNA processing exonuclease
VFHFDRGLKLTKADLAIDFSRRQPRAFVSHAHHDHMARHELALCTPETGQLYQHRFDRRRVLELPYRTPIAWGGLELTTYPAGHCLGSAMLLANDGRQSLLYTGDFKLGAAATAEEAELPRADILVMESTFGRPQYRLPPRADTIARLIELVRQAIATGRTPVIHAYVLGKGQEITKILTTAGIPVLQHESIFAISQVYERCGMPLGNYKLYPGKPVAGTAVIVPPRRSRGFRLPNLGATVSFAVTGWAIDEGTKFRWGVDHALPLSDHADFDQLIAAAQQVQAQTIYCTHGPESFVEILRERGFNALPLGKAYQTRLF